MRRRNRFTCRRATIAGARSPPPRAGTAGPEAPATPSSIASARYPLRTSRAAAGTPSPAASRSRIRRPASGARTARRPSSRRKASRPSSSSPLLLDPDRRAERRVALELHRRRVRDADAPVRDGLAEQLRQARPMDPDDPAARPLSELRVGARLDGEDAEEAVVVRDEAGRDEVVADRRLPSRCADSDPGVIDVLALPEEVDCPRVEV